MYPPTTSALLAQQLATPRESLADRQRREQQCLQVARQMLQNGCSINAIVRYTGLSEEKLRSLESALSY